MPGGLWNRGAQPLGFDASELDAECGSVVVLEWRVDGTGSGCQSFCLKKM